VTVCVRFEAQSTAWLLLQAWLLFNHPLWMALLDLPLLDLPLLELSSLSSPLKRVSDPRISGQQFCNIIELWISKSIFMCKKGSIDFNCTWKLTLQEWSCCSKVRWQECVLRFGGSRQHYRSVGLVRLRCTFTLQPSSGLVSFSSLYILFVHLTRQMKTNEIAGDPFGGSWNRNEKVKHLHYSKWTINGLSEEIVYTKALKSILDSLGVASYNKISCTYTT